MPVPTGFDATLTRVRDVLAFYRQTPYTAASSIELEDCSRGVARAGIECRVPLAAVCAELGRAATESLTHDPLAAISLGRVMTRWAAEVYHLHATSRGAAPPRTTPPDGA
jgi:hypothetical protein